jgi:hypothetical protein
MEETLVPLIFFTFLGAVTLVPILLEDRRRRAGLEILRELAARGPVDPAVLERLDLSRPHDPDTFFRRTLIAGVILTLLALGILGAHLLKPSPGLLMGSPVLGSLGVAFLILAGVTRALRKERDRQA